MGDTIAQTRFENVSKHSNDSLLVRDNTLQSDEDRLKLNELMELCTNLQNKVLDLEKTKTSQHNEIASLKRRVKINAIDADEEITLVSVQDDADKEMFDVDALKVSTAVTIVTITTKEITLAQALEALKTLKPKMKGIVFQEPERLAKEKAEKEKEANIALIEEWDDIQAKIDVGYQLAERLQAQEQEELSIEENATLFQQLLEKRRKHFAAKRA
ncbi:hypothetical protein Tco_1377041 [Tanacetum coccineum]